MNKKFLGVGFLVTGIIACNIGTGTDDVDIAGFNPLNNDGGTDNITDGGTSPIYEEKEAGAFVHVDAGEIVDASTDAGKDATSTPAMTCSEAKFTCGNFHPPDGSHVQFCGQCTGTGEACSNGASGGTCKAFAEVCPGTLYLGTCETFAYSFDPITCNLDMTDRSSKDYYTTNLATPSPCDEHKTTYVCPGTGLSTTVSTVAWNTVNRHDDAVGGAEQDYAYVGGADSLCTRNIHWLYSPFWTEHDAQKLAADQGFLFIKP